MYVPCVLNRTVLDSLMNSLDSTVFRQRHLEAAALVFTGPLGLARNFGRQSSARSEAIPCVQRPDGLIATLWAAITLSPFASDFDVSGASLDLLRYDLNSPRSRSGWQQLARATPSHPSPQCNLASPHGAKARRLQLHRNKTARGPLRRPPRSLLYSTLPRTAPGSIGCHAVSALGRGGELESRSSVRSARIVRSCPQLRQLHVSVGPGCRLPTRQAPGDLGARPAVSPSTPPADASPVPAWHFDDRVSAPATMQAQPPRYNGHQLQSSPRPPHPQPDPAESDDGGHQSADDPNNDEDQHDAARLGKRKRPISVS